MRLFAAIGLCAGVVEALDRVISSLANAVRGVTPVRRDALHLTLQFYGEMDDADTERLRAVFAHARLRSAGGRVVVGGYGQFPPRGQPRVLYAGLRQGAEAVSDLWTEVTALAPGMGEPPEEVYVPHITLARDKRGALRYAKEALGRFQTAVDTLRLESVVRAVRLYGSVLGRGGPHHTVLEETECGP